MQANKKTMLAAALAVAVVALAGVGYALGTSYSATTTNTDNGLDSTYLEIKQGTTEGYTNNFFTGVFFDTVNTSATSTTYTPVYDSAVDVAGNSIAASATAETANYALVSVKLGLTITPTNSDAESYDFSVSVTNFTPVVGFEYLMVLAKENVDHSWAIVGKDTIESTEAAPVTPVNGLITWDIGLVDVDDLVPHENPTTHAVESYSITAMLFIAGDFTGTSMNPNAGFVPAPSAPDDDVADENVFTFKVLVDTTI